MKALSCSSVPAGSETKSSWRIAHQSPDGSADRSSRIVASASRDRGLNNSQVTVKLGDNQNAAFGATEGLAAQAALGSGAAAPSGYSNGSGSAPGNSAPPAASSSMAH